MDLTNSIVGLQQGQVMARVQMAVAKKILSTQQMQGKAAIQLIEAASKGLQAGDAMVAEATGLGGNVDTYA